MPVVTFSNAARALGFRSRSALYRLRDAGDLVDYLRPALSTGGAQRLELTPPGRPPLAEHVARLIRPQITNEARRSRRPRLDPRWGMVAGLLSEALADCGGLSLCDAEAQAIAAALPAAMGEAFGVQGLELLRVALADAGCWRAGPTAPDPVGVREWWGDDGWGRFEPDAKPLEDGPFWEHVAGMAGYLIGGPFEGLTGANASELFRQLGEAIAAVELGARWDVVRWDAATARMLLTDLADDPKDDGTAAQLADLLEADRLPPELAAEVRAALAQAEQQAPAALPVVLSD